MLLFLFYTSGYGDSENLGKLPKICLLTKCWGQDSNTGLIWKKKLPFLIVVSCQIYYLLYKNSNKEWKEVSENYVMKFQRIISETLTKTDSCPPRKWAHLSWERDWETRSRTPHFPAQPNSLPGKIMHLPFQQNMKELKIFTYRPWLLRQTWNFTNLLPRNRELQGH